MNDGSRAEVWLSIWHLVAPILTAVLGWLSVRIGGYIRAKTKNELVAGMLARLNESVWEAVTAVNQEAETIIDTAKREDSPGGRKITTTEADVLRQRAKKYIRNYWGAKGLDELGKVLGLGENVKGVDDLLTTKIEAAVYQAKRAPRNPRPPAG